MRMKAKNVASKSTTTKHEFYHALDGIIQPNAQNYAGAPQMLKRHIDSAKYQAYIGKGVEYPKTMQQGSARPKMMVVKTRKASVSKGQANKYFKYSPIDVIESARGGINFEKFWSVYNLIKLPNSKWSEIIGISERTMQNIIKEKRNLDQNKSEKLLSFLTLVEYALDVLGDETRFTAWLNYKSPGLHGKAPIEYVDTFQGISMLKEQLFKIETGNLI